MHSTTLTLVFISPETLGIFWYHNCSIHAIETAYAQSLSCNCVAIVVRKSKPRSSNWTLLLTTLVARNRFVQCNITHFIYYRYCRLHLCMWYELIFLRAPSDSQFKNWIQIYESISIIWTLLLNTNSWTGKRS